MIMNKFYFHEHKQDTWKYDWLVGHIISFIYHTISKLHLSYRSILSFFFSYHRATSLPPLSHAWWTNSSLYLFFLACAMEKKNSTLPLHSSSPLLSLWKPLLPYLLSLLPLMRVVEKIFLQCHLSLPMHACPSSSLSHASLSTTSLSSPLPFSSPLQFLTLSLKEKFSRHIIEFFCHLLSLSHFSLLHYNNSKKRSHIYTSFFMFKC